LEPLNRPAFFKRNDAPACVLLRQVGWQSLKTLAFLSGLLHDLLSNWSATLWGLHAGTGHGLGHLGFGLGHLLGQVLNQGDANVRLDRAVLNTLYKAFLDSLNVLRVGGAFSHRRHRCGTAGHIVLKAIETHNFSLVHRVVQAQVCNT
jgi:hypothetical protein